MEYGRRSCHGVRPKPHQTLIGVTGALDPRGCEQRWEYRRSTRIRQGLTNETIPVDGGLYDVVIDGITDILKSVQGEEKPSRTQNSSSIYFFRIWICVGTGKWSSLEESYDREVNSSPLPWLVLNFFLSF